MCLFGKSMCVCGGQSAYTQLLLFRPYVWMDVCFIHIDDETPTHTIHSATKWDVIPNGRHLFKSTIFQCARFIRIIWQFLEMITLRWFQLGNAVERVTNEGVSTLLFRSFALPLIISFVFTSYDIKCVASLYINRRNSGMSSWQYDNGNKCDLSFIKYFPYDTFQSTVSCCCRWPWQLHRTV